MDDATLVASVVATSGFVTAAVTAYRARAERSKTQSEASGNVVTTAVEMAERLTTVAGSLITPLQAQLSDAAKEIELLKERLTRVEDAEEACRTREIELRRELIALQAQIGGRRKEDRP